MGTAITDNIVVAIQELNRQWRGAHEEIVSLEAEKNAIEEMHVDQTTALARLDEWVADVHGDGLAYRDVRCFTLSPKHGSREPNFLSSKMVASEYFNPSAYNVEFLQSILSDIIRERGAARIAEFYRKNVGISEADRERRLAEVASKLSLTRARVETIAKAAQEAGILLDSSKPPGAGSIALTSREFAEKILSSTSISDDDKLDQLGHLCRDRGAEAQVGKIMGLASASHEDKAAALTNLFCEATERRAAGGFEAA